MKHFLYAQANIPNPPNWMSTPDIDSWLDLDLDDLKTTVKDQGFIMPVNTDKSMHGEKENDIYSNRMLHVKDQASPSSYFFSKFMDENALEWAKQNLSRYVQDIRFSFTVPGRDRLGPHSDRSRSYTMIYLLKTGGKDHETPFYRLKNDPELIRPLGDHVNDYDLIERIGSVQIPMHTWTLLNARILHSIENISESRAAIQASFSDFPDDIPLIDPVYHTVDQ